VHSDEERSQDSSSAIRASQIRSDVIEAAGDMKLDSKDLVRGFQLSRQPDHIGVLDAYLALLQDRLPVYVHALADLSNSVGQGSVEDQLRLVARADIDFHYVVLAAKMAIVSRPDQLVRLREAMRRRHLSPRTAEDRLARYLEQEQQIGRVAAEICTRAVARLLLGASMNYAFSAILMGDDDMPPRDEFVADIVRGLRLSPATALPGTAPTRAWPVSPVPCSATRGPGGP
jgi:hypothetical protein